MRSALNIEQGLREGPLLEVRGLKKYFRETSFLGKVVKVTKAVDGVSFSVGRREKFCIVGESGSGKTTLARIIAGLLDYDEGELTLNGVSYRELLGKDRKAFRRRVQIIFQDPYSAINPRKSVKEFLERPMKLHGIEHTREDLLDLLESVGLTPAEEMINRMPWELSGGQRQRLFIARAISLNPELLVADEPVSMLDVTVRAQILSLLNKLYSTRGMSMILISHDMLTVNAFCDRVAVMYLGKLVEIGKAQEVYSHPVHPYSELLVRSAIKPDPSYRNKLELPEREEDPSVPQRGCRFRNRCIYAVQQCAEEEPQLVEVSPGRYSACHVRRGVSG
ncbi:MAG: ABC transporter ATP-binding protein [Fervidicoccaceae archaeon]